MTVLRRFDVLLKPTKQSVLEMKALLNGAGVVKQDPAPRQTAGGPFTIPQSLPSTISSPTPAGSCSSPTSRPIWPAFPSMCRTSSITSSFAIRSRGFQRLTPSECSSRNSPHPTLTWTRDRSRTPTARSSTRPRQPQHGLDLRGACAEVQQGENEDAGEHWTSRDALRLMTTLTALPTADEIESGTYLLHDGACGMLTVAEEIL